ncbi:MAG: hypothetical protein FWE90_03240 [Defluviitaleaceae bacterium]|nr:hypothetical protein [Defluviitaleaceae bacterium]
MVIGHNVPALKTHLSMRRSDRGLAAAMQRLSTGFRINSAKDDAAGLAIANKLSFQVNGLNRASENATHGISLVQTAEGALNEMHNMLQRMRELAVQAANDTYTAEDRSLLDREIAQLIDEIHFIANRTEFNRMRIINGEADRVSSVTKSPNPPAFIPNPPVGEPGHVPAAPPANISIPNPPPGQPGHVPGLPWPQPPASGGHPGPTPEFIVIANPTDPSDPFIGYFQDGIPEFIALDNMDLLTMGLPYSNLHIPGGTPPLFILNPPEGEPGHVAGTPPPFIVTSWNEIPNPNEGAPGHVSGTPVGDLIPNPAFGEPGHRMPVVKPNPGVAFDGTVTDAAAPGHYAGTPPHIIPNPPVGTVGHYNPAEPPATIWIPNPLPTDPLYSSIHDPGAAPSHIIVANPPPGQPGHVPGLLPSQITIPTPVSQFPQLYALFNNPSSHLFGLHLQPDMVMGLNYPLGDPNRVLGGTPPEYIPNPPVGEPGHISGGTPPEYILVWMPDPDGEYTWTLSLNPPAGDPGHVPAKPPSIIPNPPAGNPGHVNNPDDPEYIWRVNPSAGTPWPPGEGPAFITIDVPHYGDPTNDLFFDALRALELRYPAPDFITVPNPPFGEPGHVPAAAPPTIEIPNPPPGAYGHDPGPPPPTLIPNPDPGEPGHVSGAAPPTAIPNPDPGEPGHVSGAAPPTTIPNPPYGDPGHVPGIPPAMITNPNAGDPGHVPGIPPAMITIPNPAAGQPGHVPGIPPTTITITNPPAGQPGHVPAPPPPALIGMANPPPVGHPLSSFHQPAAVPDYIQIPNPPAGQPGHVPGGVPPTEIANPPVGDPGHVPPPEHIICWDEWTIPDEIPNPAPGEPGHVAGTPMGTLVPNPPSGAPGHVTMPVPVVILNPIDPMDPKHVPAPTIIPNPAPGEPSHDPGHIAPANIWIPNPPPGEIGHVPAPADPPDFIWVPNPAPDHPDYGHLHAFFEPDATITVNNPPYGSPGHVLGTPDVMITMDNPPSDHPALGHLHDPGIPPADIANPIYGQPGHVPGTPDATIDNPNPGEPGHVSGGMPPAIIPNPASGEPGHVPGTPIPDFIDNPDPPDLLHDPGDGPPDMITIPNPPPDHPHFGHLNVPSLAYPPPIIQNPPFGQPGHVPGASAIPARGIASLLYMSEQVQPGSLPLTVESPGMPAILTIASTPSWIAPTNGSFRLNGNAFNIQEGDDLQAILNEAMKYAGIDMQKNHTTGEYHMYTRVAGSSQMISFQGNAQILAAMGIQGETHITGTDAVISGPRVNPPVLAQPASLPIKIPSVPLTHAGNLTITVNGVSHSKGFEIGDEWDTDVLPWIEGLSGLSVVGTEIVSDLTGAQQSISIAADDPLLLTHFVSLSAPSTVFGTNEPLQLLNINGVPVPGTNLAVSVNGNQISVRGTGGEDIRFNIQARINPNNPPQIIFGDVGMTPVTGNTLPMDLDFGFREFGPLRLQIGPSHNNAIDIQIPRLNAETLGLVEYVAGQRRNLLLYTTSEGAQLAIGTLDRAINTVSAARARLGAFQNRLESTVRSLDVAAENTESSRSRIKDTDMAYESIKFAQYNVMFQAAQAMLGQANQRPQQLLSLLQ